MRTLLYFALLLLISSCGFNKKEEVTNEETNQSDAEIIQEGTSKVKDTLAIDSTQISQPTSELDKGDQKEIDLKSSSTPKEATKESIVTSKNEGSQNTPTATSKLQNEVEAKKEEVVKTTTSNDVDHSMWTSLLKKNVSSTGDVNYKGFLRDKALLETYLNTLAAKTPEPSWSKNAKLAYWINAYNAFTVQLIVENYPLKSIKNISNPWSKKFITLEGTSYSLEQIENEILRKMNEPRIHFAINCASVSCPNLATQAYTSNAMEKQLTEASKKFITDSSKNSITENEIKISEIFNWFSKDFKTGTTSVIDFLNRYSETKISTDAKISYLDYNWNLNE